MPRAEWPGVCSRWFWDAGMLRRKLLLNLAPLVLLLLGCGILAILLLQRLLDNLDHAATAPQVAAVAHDFRWVVLGFAVAFLAIINISVLVMLRIAGLILRPVDKLLAATHSLGQERFDTRIELDGNGGEFDELARAYNSLTERLESNERRRMETLQQVAVAVNHELNNCVATIELQLRLAGRYAPECPGLDKSLRQINQSLQRITSAVQSLKNVRRIVLTDYLPGTKMLDLQRSSEREDGLQKTSSAGSSGHITE
jgi:signal transduction histidine kinase